MTSPGADLEQLVLDSYLTSARKGSFNGVRALDAIAASAIDGSPRDVIADLIQSEHIDCIFDLNPYIKRFPELRKEQQLERLQTEELHAFCLYPSRSLLRETVGATEFQDMPFSRALLLGEAQLSVVAFELGVLARYRNDPRYVLRFQDYMGDTSISNAFYENSDMPDRDKISVSTFGLGFDDKSLPHIVVFYRYLVSLTPEHQQYWNSFRSQKPALMCEPYFQRSIMGEFWKNRSIRYAIEQEMRLINEMAEALAGQRFFRQEMTDDLPFDLSAFLVPSTENFATLIHSWDKLLSDNINRDFFAGKLDLTYDEMRKDGRLSVRDKGTLMLLREWLEKVVVGKDRQMIVDQVVRPMQNVRKLRQQPAHTFQKNEFSEEFHQRRREILSSIFLSLSCLRVVFSRFPSARAVKVPEWLDSNEIDVF